MHNNPNSLYEKAKNSLASLVVQYAFVFLGFTVMLLLTGGTPPGFLVGFTFCLAIAFVAWSENNRTTHNPQLSQDNKLSMEQMVSLLRGDVAEWNNWKEQNRSLKIDLRRVNLSKANLRRADLRGVDLSEANLKGADLTGADLSKATLCGTTFDDAKLGNANLKRVNLRGANLSRADLSKADLSKANLRRTNFKRAILSEASLNKAFLIRANLSKASLNRANLSGADLSGAYFIKFFLIWVDLIGVSVISTIFFFESKFYIYNWITEFIQIYLSYFLSFFFWGNIIGIILILIRPSGIFLIGINLIGCFLIILGLCTSDYVLAIVTGVIFIGANLREVKFFRADLSMATLGGTDLRGTNIIGANVEQARFCYNLGLSERDKNDLRKRGAIVDEPPNEDYKKPSQLPFPSNA